MNDNGEKQKTTDSKSWLTRSLEIKNASSDEVIANFKEILAIQGFKRQKENVTRERRL